MAPEPLESLGQSHLCRTHRAWCWASTGRSGPRATEFSAVPMLVPRPGAHGLCLGQLMACIQLPSAAGPEQQNNKAPAKAKFSSGLRALWTQRRGVWLALHSQSLCRGEKMQPGELWIGGSLWLSARSRSRLHAGPGAAVEMRETSTIRSSLLPHSSPVGAASGGRWVSDLKSYELWAHD